MSSFRIMSQYDSMIQGEKAYSSRTSGFIFRSPEITKIWRKPSYIAYFYESYAKCSQNMVTIGPKFVLKSQITKSKTATLPESGKIFSSMSD